MNIIGIAICTAGIAHTYIAKEKLITAAKNAGHNIHIETQGTIGVQDEIPDELIESADIVILAIDVKVSGRERFANKKIIEVPTEIAIKSPNKLIKKIEEAISQ